MSKKYDSIIVLTTGKQDRGTRATLALAWGCASLAMGKSVMLYMTMDGTVWSLKSASKNVQVDGFEPVAEYIKQFADLGGDILVCAPCSEYYCSISPGQAQDGVIPNVALSGLATVVSLLTPGTNVVTF